jgi:predicted restriction endonuclease
MVDVTKYEGQGVVFTYRYQCRICGFTAEFDKTMFDKEHARTHYGHGTPRHDKPVENAYPDDIREKLSNVRR